MRLWVSAFLFCVENFVIYLFSFFVVVVVVLMSFFTESLFSIRI